MITIAGIAGSLRKASFNASLLRAAASTAPDGCELKRVPLAGIPLFDQDVLEAEGHPPAVVAMKEALTAADGLIIASPEYNHGIPGVLKNAIDWVSRPASDIPAIFGDLPTLLIGVGGQSGTRFAQTAWLPVFRVLKMRPWFGRTLYGEGASDLFDEAGELTDEGTRTQLQKVVTQFAAHCEALPRQRH